MKLRDCSFLADENISPAVVDFLRRNCRAVESVDSLGLRNCPDHRVLEEAWSGKHVVLTHDSDFGSLAVARGHEFFGILYVRPGHIKNEFTIQTIRTLLSGDIEITAGTIIVADRQGDAVKIRIRRVE